MIKALDIIRSIDHNGLNESEAEILRKAVQKIKASRRKDFDQTLKRASEIGSKLARMEAGACGSSAPACKAARMEMQWTTTKT